MSELTLDARHRTRFSRTFRTGDFYCTKPESAIYWFLGQDDQGLGYRGMPSYFGSYIDPRMSLYSGRAYRFCEIITIPAITRSAAVGLN